MNLRMPKFSYKVLDTRGQVRSGVLDAPDRAAAEQELVKSGVKVQALDMLRDSAQSQAMKAINPNSPTSGAMRVTVPPPPARAHPSAEKTSPTGDSGGTHRPPPPAGQASRPNHASGSIQRPPGISLAPEPPPEPPVSTYTAPEPSSAPVEAPEPQGLLKPLLALGMVAAGLVALYVTAFTAPADLPIASEHQTISLSGRLPSLPEDTTVVFDFPEGDDIERTVAQLNVGHDGQFEIALQVPAPPDSFQVRARRPGQVDLVSPICTMDGSRGELTGELAAEKTKIN